MQEWWVYTRIWHPYRWYDIHADDFRPAYEPEVGRALVRARDGREACGLYLGRSLRAVERGDFPGGRPILARLTFSGVVLAEPSSTVQDALGATRDS